MKRFKRRYPPKKIPWQNPAQLAELEQYAKHLATTQRIEALHAMLEESSQLRKTCPQLVSEVAKADGNTIAPIKPTLLRELLGGF